jgi:CubicO group peptidase (beta-lactamase class C family)
MKRLTARLLFLTIASPVLAQGQGMRDHPRVAEAIHLVETWIEAQRAYEDIPGVSAALVYDQQVLWAKGFGQANRARRMPATPQTIYSICSISKLFTSIGVMQLRDGGQLRLDDSVGAHLDWFYLADTYPDAPPVTIQGVLTHSAGLPRESDYPYWSPPDFPFPTRQQLVERLSAQEELYPAFDQFQYSNLGLSLAGEIIAATSGMTYADYVRSHILGPLAMSATFSEIPAAEHGKRMAIGYTAPRRDGSRREVSVFQARGIAPAAGFASTVLDLAKFASWQFRVLHDGADELLSGNTLREMHRVHWINPDWELKWGLGFATWRDNDRTYVGHGGGCPGFITHFNLDPKGKVAAIFLSNANGVNSSRFTRRAHEIVGPAIRTALDTSHVAEATDPALEVYTGTYDEAPWWGERAVVLWDGRLGVLSLPTDDPMDNLVKLEKTGEHTFRRIRDNGDLAEEWRFDIGPDGRAVRMWQHSNFSPRVTGR